MYEVAGWGFALKCGLVLVGLLGTAALGLYTPASSDPSFGG